ncbi:MAG: DUF4402 domain-containing protein [Novosphingobium sp.]
MPRILRIWLLAVYGLWLAVPAHAAPAPIAVPVQLEIIDPLSVSKMRDMDFGNVIPTANAGTVVMTPASTATCTAAGGIIQSGPCQAAEFMGRALPGEIFRLKLPPGRTMTLTGPGTSMVVDNMTTGISAGLSLISFSPGNGFARYLVTTTTGEFRYYIAGRLNVGANQTPGAYSGTFTIMLDYK